MKQINTGKGRRKKKCSRGTKSELLTGWEAAVHEASLAQMVKNLPAMQETWIRSLGQEDRLEKGRATHSSILPGAFHGRRSLVGYRPLDHKESDTTEWQQILSLAAEQSPLLLLQITTNAVTKKCRHSISQPGLAPLCIRLWFLSAGIDVSAGCQETLGRICSQVDSHHWQNPFSFDFRAQIPVSWMAVIRKTSFALGKPLSSPCPLTLYLRASSPAWKPH